MDKQRSDIRRSAATHYAAGGAIWVPGDRWNSIKRRSIDAFGRRHKGVLSESCTSLNAGAGSDPYDWMPPNTVSLDRFPSQLEAMPLGVVADLEQLPFPNATFGAVVCVGSVLNYVSAIEALTELVRVLRPSGVLMLHFETSDSFEHLGSSHWRREAHPLQTLNNGKPDVVWIYSRAFIRRRLSHLGIRVFDKAAFHIGSAAILRLGASQQSASQGARFDRFLTPLSAFADDLILIGRKI